MKIALLSIIFMAMVILMNCSGDRVIEQRYIYEMGDVESADPTYSPNPENPTEFGDNEYGPPTHLNFSYIANGNINGARVEILVGAVLHYDDSSPCTTPGIEVNFEISPDTLAAINSSCYTNEWGMVSNKLVYPTRYCNEVIQLTVSCGAIVDTFTFALPIAGAEINIDAEPQRLWAEQPGAYDTSFISCQLVDGVGNGIRNGKILFVALVSGEICGPQWGYTDDRGYAYTEYRMRYEDIPDGNNDPNSIETGVRGALFGYPDVEAEVALHCARP